MSPDVNAVNAVLEGFADFIPCDTIVMLLKSLMICISASTKCLAMDN